MLNFLKRRPKTKAIPQKDRHKPSIILNTNKEKGYKRNQIRTKPNVNFKGILFGLLGIVVILGLVYLINNFFSIKDFKLDKISILGNKTISDTEINDVISTYKGKHIALIDTKDVENELRKAFPIINGIQITKLYPNKLFIKINEREPKLAYININGAYILDTNGKILNILSSSKIEFSPDKILIARGLGDLNSQILQDYFLNEFILTNNLGEKTQTERDQLIATGYSFATITQDQKTPVLRTLSVEYQKEIDNFFAKNTGLILGSKYRDLFEVYALQNKELNIDESVDVQRQNLTLELISRLNASNMEYNQIRWEGSILVKVYLKDNKQLVFGSGRSLSEQWDDYLLVSNDLAKRGRGFSSIDISSTKISVIN